METPRRCAICNTALAINRDEGPKRFAARQTCGGPCVKTLRAMRQNEKRIQGDRECAVCGNAFGRRDGEDSGNFRKKKTCGDDCFKVLISRINSDGKQERLCFECGRPFARRPNEAAGDFKRRKTCGGRGSECHRSMMTATEPPASKSCTACGREFFRRGNEPASRYLKRRTCGDKPCRIAASTTHVFGVRTDIEIAVRDALVALGVPFEEQKWMGGFVVDFWLPTANAIVECNGDYWHANPAKFPDGPIFPAQVARVRRDAELARYAAMQRRGLLVLWQSDIHGVGADGLLVEALGDKIAT